ncbi:aspartyl/asparaginyl beta-hydroxylase domain-containing protein [Maribellus sediminis]|uniref:aspartyl/asparaginyl beta-hydroxylase domain-containing protein n=1 Tax=Maribellus sediminis TaxID=2696285 RepID=UPI001431C83A|nr:aspartyl/asparaginyl beta-hydroxylase domain-containing protein [Maribellus sediminis]
MSNRQITKHLKFPIRFDQHKLAHDLSLALKKNWIPHFNTSGYSGEWTVIPLYTSNGDETNIFAISPEAAEITETPILKECRYFREVVESFKFPVMSARLLRLGAGAEIKPHRDHELGYEDGTFRLHIPIVTNSRVEFILDGEQLLMSPGECWYTNVNFIHSVSNRGETDRVHLVIDGLRNEWTDKLFYAQAPPDSFQKMPDNQESPETIKRIIEELERSNEPAAKQLIAELTQKRSSGNHMA